VSGIRFYILDLGIIECDEVWLVTAPRPGTVENKTPPANWVALPTYAVLVEHPTLGRVLYDCGCSPEWRTRWPKSLQSVFPWTKEVALKDRLAELGLKPDDIDLLVVSHLHMDHAGNIDLFSGTKAGRNVIVSKPEAMYAFYVTNIGPDPNVGAYVKADFSNIPGIVYQPVAQDMEIAKGLELFIQPGHTPGVLGMIVHTENTGTVIFTSDGIYSSKNYGPPPNVPGLCYDSQGFISNVEKVRLLQRKYNAQVFFGHDPAQYEGLRKAPQFYD